MTRRRTFLLLLAAGIAVVVCYVFVLPLSNPLRRSAYHIAASLLEQTPPGTTREEVEALIRARGWPPGGTVSNERDAVSVMLGDYYDLPFDIAVYARWKFDEHGRVLTVEVSKFTRNAL
jgi:hypothetical protein